MAALALSDVEAVLRFIDNLGTDKQFNEPVWSTTVRPALQALVDDQAALKAALVVADTDLDTIAAIATTLGDATAAATAAAVKTAAAVAASTARIA